MLSSLNLRAKIARSFSSVFLGAVLFVSLFLSYSRVPFLFFQQDELFVFGLFVDRGIGIVLRGLTTADTIHFIPLLNFIDYLLFQIFKLNYIAYNVTGLIIHFLNGLLIYFITKPLIRDRLFALLSAIVFLTSGVSAQLVMWPLVSIGTLSLSFALLVWMYIIKYQEGGMEVIQGILLVLFFVLSLFIAEYAIGLYLFIPAAVLVIKGKTEIKQTLRFLLPFATIGIGYALIRLPSVIRFGIFSGVDQTPQVFSSSTNQLIHTTRL